MTVRHQMPELDRGLFCPLHKLGGQNTPYKLGLNFSLHSCTRLKISWSPVMSFRESIYKWVLGKDGILLSTQCPPTLVCV